MTQTGVSTEGATLEVENVGGIEQTSAEFTPGVTILTGRNATNRTSFLQALMAVSGSDSATLKADASEGSIELTLSGETYSRTLTERDGRIVMGGNPYLDDPTLADLFAFLLESNDCRQAVARGANLREIIMRPIDTAEIEADIERFEDRKDEIESQIEDIDKLEKRIPELERERQDILADIESKEAILEEKKEEKNEIDDDIEESLEGKEELEEKIDELNRSRNEIENLRRQIESERESIEALEAEKEEIENSFEDLSPVSDERITDLEQESQRLRGQVDAIDQTVTELQSIIQFNAGFLEDGQPEVANEMQENDATDDASVTSELLPESDDVTCWTCGTRVDPHDIESTLDELRSLRKGKIQERQSLEEEIQELQSEKNDLQERKQRYQRLRQQIGDAEVEIEERQESLETMKTREEKLEAEIEELEVAVAELQEEDYSAILEVNEEVNKLEFEIDQLQSELSDVEDEIESIERKKGEREELEAQREDVQKQLRDLRNRVDTLQKRAIEEFNERMEVVLDLLEYENLERIWIERTHENVREGRRKVEKERFDLHVVRSTDTGTVYEDTVDHLSESEREVTGLVFALAGYLVHEVYEEVPFMLLDSIEAIDSERIAKVVDYLRGHADYLIVALLEEDAAALDDNYSRITSI